MSESAHPQRDDEEPADGPEPDVVVKNPFPASMTVPGVDGEDVALELAVVDGIVYAPDLDAAPITASVRQYVTQYCAVWSTSVVTAGKLQNRQVEPPRRASVMFGAAQLHAMLGLAGDESLVAVVVDPMTMAVRFVVESPRLPCKQSWDVEPPAIGLPIGAWYEGAGGATR